MQHPFLTQILLATTQILHGASLFLTQTPHETLLSLTRTLHAGCAGAAAVAWNGPAVASVGPEHGAGWCVRGPDVRAAGPGSGGRPSLDPRGPGLMCDEACHRAVVLMDLCDGERLCVCVCACARVCVDSAGVCSRPCEA
eukprot:773504-Rhodomonas_salina.1